MLTHTRKTVSGVTDHSQDMDSVSIGREGVDWILSTVALDDEQNHTRKKQVVCTDFVLLIPLFD